jgi:hypothetical protein
VLIFQTEPLVETFLRQAKNYWQYTTVTECPDAVVQLESIGSTMALKDIYNKIELGEE